MYNLNFKIYFCGMSEETFSDQIMIYKPHSYIEKRFNLLNLQQINIESISELIVYLKKDPSIIESLGTWGMKNFSISTVYVYEQPYLLGFQDDKKISEILIDLNTNQLELAYFIVGGASFHNETSYRFTIHPNENRHKYMPHVHVSKSGVEIRYSLKTLLPIDPLVNPHKRDNQKIIIPFLKDNQSEWLKLWDYYIKGYTIPEITEDGKQFYAES